jgi:hypothetical protein
MCGQHAAYRWKALDKGYNFSLNLIVISDFHKKLCALKVAGVPILRISGLPLGSFETKSHLDVAPRGELQSILKRGKVVDSPKSGVC